MMLQTRLINGFSRFGALATAEKCSGQQARLVAVMATPFPRLSVPPNCVSVPT